MFRFLGIVFVFALGFAAGAWCFRDVQPRSLLTVRPTRHLESYRELLGYLGSAAMQRFPGALPGVVMESDKSIAIRYPIKRPHWVIVPKRDIKDMGSLSKGDEPYLMDTFAMIGKIARDANLKNYQVITNGPHEQTVRYLHFHLVAVYPKDTKDRTLP
jgi:diadenosine tetraphosphate (Ap4A) HIT family hydrolase